MALRNAFENVVTEGTLRRLLDQLRFARTSTDQLRVVIDSGATDLSAIRWANNNSFATWYSTGAGNSMDQRENQRQIARANMLTARHSRWTIT